MHWPFAIPDQISTPKTTNIYCSSKVLVALSDLCRGNKRSNVKPRRYYLHMIHNTLVVRSLRSLVPPNYDPNANLTTWIPPVLGLQYEDTCTYEQANIPFPSQYIHTTQYDLGPLRRLIWSKCDAFVKMQGSPERKSTDDMPGNWQEYQDTASKLLVAQAGTVIPTSQVVELKAIREGRNLSLHKRARFDGSWFKGISTVYWGILSRVDQRDCLEINEQQLRTSEVLDSKRQRYQRLCTLLLRLKGITKTSRRGLCVATFNSAASTQEKTSIDVWEPELDVETLDVRQVPQHLRFQTEVFPDDFVEQFWVRNRKTPTPAERASQAPTESKPFPTTRQNFFQPPTRDDAIRQDAGEPRETSSKTTQEAILRDQEQPVLRMVRSSQRRRARHQRKVAANIQTP
jgi:hypothetical protein